MARSDFSFSLYLNTHADLLEPGTTSPVMCSGGLCCVPWESSSTLLSPGEMCSNPFLPILYMIACSAAQPMCCVPPHAGEPPC